MDLHLHSHQTIFNFRFAERQTAWHEAISQFYEHSLFFEIMLLRKPSLTRQIRREGEQAYMCSNTVYKQQRNFFFLFNNVLNVCDFELSIFLSLLVRSLLQDSECSRNRFSNHINSTFHAWPSAICPWIGFSWTMKYVAGLKILKRVVIFTVPIHDFGRRDSLIGMSSGYGF